MSESVLGIIAGGGALPHAIAQSVTESGRKVHVLAVRGSADEAWLENFPHEWMAIGEWGRSVKLLAAAGAKDVVLVGRVDRPTLSEIKFDAKGLMVLPSLIAAARKGDDAMLKVTSDFYGKEGFRVLTAAEAAPDLVTGQGALGQLKPNAEHDDDIGRAFAIIRALGALDVGQAAIVCEGLPLCVEAAEGTDAMIARVASLRKNLRGTPDRKRGVLAKALKATQDRRTDLPVIGVETVRGAHAVGLAGIALEADASLIVDKRAVAAEADRLGLFVVGVSLLKQKTLMLVCGEPSGDQLGGQLMAALKQLAGDSVTIAGVGGAAMAREGLKSLFPLETMAVMGLREVVPAIPAILRRVQEATAFALETHPDAVVLIDSPDFTHRIARAVKKADPSIPTVNYVAPQVWATRAYRAKAMAKYFDLVLALFPFEVPFFEKYGLKAAFVGHPVIERSKRMTGGDALRARLGIAAGAPVLAMLPGSRTSEIRLMFSTFRATVEILAHRIPGLVTILPTVPHVAAKVREKTNGWPTPLFIIENEADKFAAFDAADVALAASGTVTAEIALSRTPMVVFYILGGLTYALGIWLYNSRFFTLLNILLDREAAPEFLQAKATPQALAAAVEKLFTDEDARAAQIEAMNEFAMRLGEGEEAPSMRAARVLLDFIK